VLSFSEKNFVPVLEIIIVGLIVGGIKWLYLGFNKVGWLSDLFMSWKKF